VHKASYQGAKNSTREGVPANTVDSKLLGVSSLTAEETEATDAPTNESTGKRRVVKRTIVSDCSNTKREKEVQRQ